MQISATARFELEMDNVMKQQHSIAASISRIDGNSTDGIARSPGAQRLGTDSEILLGDLTCLARRVRRGCR